MENNGSPMSWLETGPTVENGGLPRRSMTDTEVVDALVGFYLTPEWSVSMLEDVAELVRCARPEVVDMDDLDEDDPNLWWSH